MRLPARRLSVPWPHRPPAAPCRRRRASCRWPIWSRPASPRCSTTRSTAGRPSPSTSPNRSMPSAPWSWPAASGCDRRSATGASSAPAATPTTRSVVDAGAAFELLHAFALVHDDVMDGSAMRRGRPHRAPRLRRPPPGRGLAGRAPPLRRGRGHPRRRPRPRLRRPAPAATPAGAVLDVWDELRIELNVGQYLDILGTARGDTDPEAARRIARYKSGKYTIERPLHVGAALAGRYDELGPLLSRLRRPARRGLPAARRHPRRLRRARRHRQARRRRPARGQADAAARHRQRGPPTPASARCSPASASPT